MYFFEAISSEPATLHLRATAMFFSSRGAEDWSNLDMVERRGEFEVLFKKNSKNVDLKAYKNV